MTPIFPNLQNWKLISNMTFNDLKMAKRSRLASGVVSAIVLMSENEDAVRKHIEKMYHGGHPKVFLPEKWS